MKRLARLPYNGGGHIADEQLAVGHVRQLVSPADASVLAKQLSDPAVGVFQSDTGEIIMRSRENLLKVRTRRTEAVTLEAGKSETVGVLRVENSSVPACVAVCSVTGEPLASTERMVLIYATEMVNTGMVVGYDRRLMKDTGKGPALMRCGKLEAPLKCSGEVKLSLYARGFDGARLQELPVRFVDGALSIEIDTALLANGPTSFFELVKVK